MLSCDHLPGHIDCLLQSMLATDEVVIWKGRPLLRARLLGISIGIVPYALVSLYLASGSRNVVISTLFVCFGVLLPLLLALAMISANRLIGYALTDRRAIVIRIRMSGHVSTKHIDPLSLCDVKYSTGRCGIGSISWVHGIPGMWSFLLSRGHGFYEINHAKDVYNLMLGIFVPLVAEMAKSGDASVRRRAVLGIRVAGKYAVHNMSTLIECARHDEDKMVRVSAVRGLRLAELRNDKVLATLRRLTLDADEDVSAAARRSLVCIMERLERERQKGTGPNGT